MSLNERIQQSRKKLHLSQEQLAEKVGVTRQTISKWELGETAPDIKQAQILSQIFNVSLDELTGNDTNEAANEAKNRKQEITRPWIKRMLAFSAAVLCLCFVIAGIFSIVGRLQILNPQGLNENIVITQKASIQIGHGKAETIVFNEADKPTVKCKLPEGFVSDAKKTGLYIDKAGNFIQFNADFSQKVSNPLLGTDYFAYYEDRGYHSYMDMARLAMYYDSPKFGIFSSTQELYLSGGAKLIRQQLCAGQNADYYPIDGGLTENGKAMRLYGFALHFENTTWLITLKDCNDIYYFITIKDPSGVGKTIGTVGEWLASISISE